MTREFLERPMKCSTAFQFYIPMGNKTGVTVVGDYKPEGADEEATKKAVIQMSEKSFNGATKTSRR